MRHAKPPAAGPAGAPAAPSAATAAKPFLRRGSGWAARVTAAREGRRYVPRGGNIKDYSKEDEVPAPPRAARPRPPSRIPRSPAPKSGGTAGKPTGSAPAPAAPASKRAVGSSGYGARSRVASAAGMHPPAAAAPRAAIRSQAGRAAPTSAAGLAAPQQQRQGQGQQREAAGAALPGLAGDVWTQKLLQAGGPQEQQQPWESRHAQEEEALGEFEALESLVLREVGNEPLAPAPGSGHKSAAAGAASAGCAGKAGSRRASPGAGGWPAGPGVIASPQGWPDGGGEEEGDVFDVFTSEGSLHWGVHEKGGGQQPGTAHAAAVQERDAAAAGAAHPLARRAVTFGAAQTGRGPASQLPAYLGGPEEEAEMEAESSFQERPPHRQLSSSQAPVRQHFSQPPAHSRAAPFGMQLSQGHGGQQLFVSTQQQRGLQAGSAFSPPPPPPPPACGTEAEAVEQLQQEVVRLQEERARVARLRLELEESAARLEQDRAAHEKRKAEDTARFEAERAEELRKLQRDRRVLEKQSRAILKMPTKQSKEEVAAVEALLAEERRLGRARETCHKLATERLRQQVLELQAKNAELKEQVRYLEQQAQQGQQWSAGGGGAAAAAGEGRSAAAAAVVPGLRAAAAAGGAGRSGRARQAGGLPAVSVERAARRSSAAAIEQGDSRGLRQVHFSQGQHAAAGPLAAQQQGLGEEEGSDGEDGEPLIADVEVVEEEVVEVLLEEQPEAGDSWPSGQASLSALPGQAAAAGPPPVEGASSASQVMSKASSALERFNQLRASLARHEGLQGRLASRLSSLQTGGGAPVLPAASSAGLAAPAEQQHSRAGASFQPSPLAAAAAGSQPVAAAAEDDLRRLGRTLLAAGAGPSLAATPELADSLALPEQSYPHGSPPQHQLAAHQPSQQGQQAALVIHPQASPALPPQPGSAEDAVVSEERRPDGRLDRLYASGLREQRFANGSTKQSLPGGGASLTRFANGDVKKALPCGAVEYFYAEVDSWQVTHPTGADVFFFPSGQVEAHHPGGVKEILFPDGTVRKALPDGRELAISAAHLSREIQRAQPRPSLLAA